MTAESGSDKQAIPPDVIVVGAGLAGCETCHMLARFGLTVELLEMKPEQYSPAHSLSGPAELVCSNSLKSDALDTAHGLLKSEMRKLGSIVLRAAEYARVPAGSALAVDRLKLSERVAGLLAKHGDRVRYRPGVPVTEPPAGEVVLATGPLTSRGLSDWLIQRIGPGEDLYFYDALAPIIDAESIDRQQVFSGSRWGKGGDDYLNCPMDEDQYRRFVAALKTAERVPLHAFEDVRYFEGCLPIEVLVDRGDEVLAHGPMRPVGLSHAGRMPHAVVQLRTENEEGSAFNLVGFQTKLTMAAQREVFRLIPGLQHARFLRYGAVHRNLYVHAPRLLTDGLQLVAEPRIRLAGQIVGVEGYVESAAMGMLVGLLIACDRRGIRCPPPPADTAIGALYAHVRGNTEGRQYEPMNIHFGLLPNPGGRGRANRRQKAVDKARESFDAWWASTPVSSLPLSSVEDG